MNTSNNNWETMDTTNVMVKFSIIGDNFCPNDVSKELNIVPDESWIKGDPIKGRNPKIRRVETKWGINIKYEESLDIKDQLQKILKRLVGKNNVLKKIRSKYDVTYLFIIVVNVENDVKPAMYFDTDFIEFVHDIKAEFFIDLYNFS